MSVSRVATAIVGLLAMALPAMAADLPARTPAPAPAPAFVPDWTYRVTPYAWLTSLNGSQMVRGRGVDVNATFPDIINATLGSGGSLVALMADFEARKGPFAIFGDVIWQNIGIERSGVRSRRVDANITGTLGAAVDVQYQMAIVEAGGAYQVAQFGAVELDVLAGARYWYQTMDVAVDLATTVDIRDLVVSGNRALAKSGSVDWIDAFAGVRARIALTPTQRIELRGDLGGGGSKFSWNAIAAYAYDFASKNGVTYSALIGYKALYVDYVQGSGRTRYEFDMLQHGPVLGLNVRF